MKTKLFPLILAFFFLLSLKSNSQITKLELEKMLVEVGTTASKIAYVRVNNSVSMTGDRKTELFSCNSNSNPDFKGQLVICETGLKITRFAGSQPETIYFYPFNAIGNCMVGKEDEQQRIILIINLR
jgi:hypothetical protein